MEKVADNMLFPCQFSISGCESMLKYTEKESHENEECDFRPLNCPFILVDRCVVNFSGDRNELLAHLVESHDGQFKLFTAQNFKISCHPPREKQSNKTYRKTMATFIVEFDNNNFVLNQIYFHNNVSAVYFVTVQLMGSTAKAENYTYSIILKGSDQQLSFRGKCFSLHKEVMSIYENRECLNFDAATALKFHHPFKHGENQRNIFKFEVKLLKKEELPTIKSPIKHTARISTEGKAKKIQRVTGAAKMSPPVTRSRKRKCCDSHSYCS